MQWFRDALGTLAVNEIGRVEGFNYSSGDARVLAFFTRAK
jgi:hypothetical protein